MQSDLHQENYLKCTDNAISFNFSFVDQIRNLFIMILEKISLNDELKSILFNSNKCDPKILFSQVDFQFKGYITLEDLEYFLKQINYLFPDTQKNVIIRKFIRLYDKKGDFTISYNDFCNVISPINKKTVFNNTEIIRNINELFYNVLLNEFELIEFINSEVEKIGKCDNYNSYEAFMIIGQGQKYINNDSVSAFINNRYPINYVDYLVYLIDNNNDKLIDYNEFQDFFVPYKNLDNVRYSYNNNQIGFDDYKNSLCINSSIKRITRSKSYDYLNVMNNGTINNSNQNNNNFDSNNKPNIELNNANELNNLIHNNLEDPTKTLTYNDLSYTNQSNFISNCNPHLKYTAKTDPEIIKSNTTQKFPEVFHTENNFKFKIYENENQLYNTVLNEQNSKMIDNNYTNNYQDDDIKPKAIEYHQIDKNIDLFIEKENNNNAAQSKFIDYNDYIQNKSSQLINGQEKQTEQKETNNNKINFSNNLLNSYFLEYLDLIIKKESKLQIIKESLCLRDDMTPNELFLLFDKKQRGFISINDFKFICKNILFLYPTTDQIRLVYKRYNINKNNKLNNVEFFNMINPVKEEYKDIFFSKNNKNKMDMKLSIKSKNIIINLIKVIIENESIYYEMRKKMRKAGCIWEGLKNLFKEYSKNGNDGAINKDGFGCFLNDIGFVISNYQNEILFSFFDKSKDGIIKYKEIVDDLNKM